LAGLSPEQIAQIRTYEIGGERARQEPIATMIQAQLGLSREDLENQRVKLLQAQEERSRQLLGPEIRERESRARAAEAARAFDEYRVKQLQSMSDLERRKVLTEIGSTEALTRSREASTELTRLQAELARTTNPLEKQRIQEQINHTQAQIQEIGKSRELRERQYQEGTAPITYYDSEGNPYTVRTSGEALASAAARKGEGSDKTFTQQHTLRTEARQTEADRKKEADEATEAETLILNNPSSESVKPKLEEFNRKSSQPYFYVPDPGAYYGFTAKKVPLVDFQGKSRQARIVYRNYQLYKQNGGEGTLEEFVDKFIRRQK
jgi:hypothetical protein